MQDPLFERSTEDFSANDRDLERAEVVSGLSDVREVVSRNEPSDPVQYIFERESWPEKLSVLEAMLGRERLGPVYDQLLDHMADVLFAEAEDLATVDREARCKFLGILVEQFALEPTNDLGYDALVQVLAAGSSDEALWQSICDTLPADSERFAVLQMLIERALDHISDNTHGVGSRAKELKRAICWFANQSPAIVTAVFAGIERRFSKGVRPSEYHLFAARRAECRTFDRRDMHLFDLFASIVRECDLESDGLWRRRIRVLGSAIMTRVAQHPCSEIDAAHERVIW